MMNLLETIAEDYQNFPQNQTYSIYAENVYFQDPLNKFRGVKRYQQMIGFIGTFFKDIDLTLYDISQQENIIKTEWTLAMTSPLPWKPRLIIPGYSQLIINDRQLIISHIDYWHISPIKVFLQIFNRQLSERL
jgi:hypothetical protein